MICSLIILIWSITLWSIWAMYLCKSISSFHFDYLLNMLIIFFLTNCFCLRYFRCWRKTRFKVFFSSFIILSLSSTLTFSRCMAGLTIITFSSIFSKNVFYKYSFILIAWRHNLILFGTISKKSSIKYLWNNLLFEICF